MSSYEFLCFFLCKETAELFLSKLIYNNFAISPGWGTGYIFDPGYINVMAKVIIKSDKDPLDSIKLIFEKDNINHLGYNFTRLDGKSSTSSVSNIPKSKISEVKKTPKKSNNNLLIFPDFKKEER